MAGHSHDGIDWDTRLERLRADDELAAPETALLARRLLTENTAAVHSVIDVGSGAGGSAAAFAAAMSDLGTDGTVTLVDSAPELLSAASEHAGGSAGHGVRISTVEADADDDALRAAVEPADLVFASFVVHHLPDQLAGLRRLTALVKPGGRLAIVESGLHPRVLPWDVGVGEPGLEDRLASAWREAFRRMRADMPGAVRLPVGWSTALERAGLSGVRSFSYLVDRPAPTSEAVRDVALRHLESLHTAAAEECAADDVEAVRQLVDPDSEHYAGNRSDLYYLMADTVHVGTRPAE